MKSFKNFINREDSFWAYVRFVSEKCGYSDNNKKLRRYTIDDLVSCSRQCKLNVAYVIDPNTKEPTTSAEDILLYLNDRALTLEKEVEPLLMNIYDAKLEFDKIKSTYTPKCSIPMNKQKGDKRHPAYLTGIVNMLTELTLDGCNFDDNPRGLSVVYKDNTIVKTFSRWMDGAYPSKINPIALWEIKEYYGTKTFGSRVADGVYETMLDGLEIKDLYNTEDIKILHYLIIDDHFTWWECGKSYLCRIVDLMNMGLVDEVIVGKEVITRWPEIVKSWTNNLPCQQ